MKVWHFITLCAVFLAACTSEGRDDSSFGQVAAALAPAKTPPRVQALLRANAPRLEVGNIRKKTKGLVLLEARKDGYEYWLSGDGSQLILQNGMLHGTRGMGEGLLASELSQPLAHVLGLTSGWSDRFHTYLNGNDQAVTRTYRCQIDATSETQSGHAAVRVVREECSSLDQKFANIYWVDVSSRQIVQSRQWVGPFVGSISTRLVN